MSSRFGFRQHTPQTHKPKNQTTHCWAIQTQTQYLTHQTLTQKITKHPNKSQRHDHHHLKQNPATTKTRLPMKPNYQKDHHETQPPNRPSKHQISPPNWSSKHWNPSSNGSSKHQKKPTTKAGHRFNSITKTHHRNATTKTQQPSIRSNQNLVRWEEINERNMLWIEKEEWET